MPVSPKPLRALAASSVVLASLAIPAVAHAATNGNVVSGSAQVEDTTIVRTTTTVAPNVPNAVAPEVLGETVSASNLPMTGTDVAELAVIGAGSIGIGVVFLAGRRRRARA